MAMLQHAFMVLRKGQGLLSPYNWVIQQWPQVVYLHQNGAFLEAIQDIQTILRASIQRPTECKDSVLGWLDFIKIVNASSHGVGGVVVGELSTLPPTVFRFQWPSDISQDLVSFNNPKGIINNSDLEMAGLLFLWLCIKAIAPDIAHKHIALFSNNFPMVSWVDKMALQKITHPSSPCTRPCPLVEHQ